MYIAKEMDGGEFIPLNQGIVAEGDWEIVDVIAEVDAIQKDHIDFRIKTN